MIDKKEGIKMKAKQLKIIHLHNPLGIDDRKPRFTWVCEGGQKQTAFHIKVWDENNQNVFDSGQVKKDDMACMYDGAPLESRMRYTWVVEVWDEENKMTVSEPAWFEMGLLNKDDWHASWISGKHDEKKVRRPADYFHKSFLCEKKIKKARLYATALGIYEVRINQKKLHDFILAPGYTDYTKRVHYQTYDVTRHLQNQNELVFILGDGWFKGKLGFDGDQYVYGTNTKLLAQLEIIYEDDTKETISTNETFAWSDDGQIRYNDMKDGLVIDARKNPTFTKRAIPSSWNVSPTASNAPAIKEHETFVPELLISPSGKKILDFKQNIAGYVAFRVKGEKGKTIRLRMFEELDDGEYSDASFQSPPDRKHRTAQEICVILSGQVDEIHPNFTFMGFRYALIEGLEDVHPDDFQSIALYSDMDFVGSFSCSDAYVNRFVENTIWSQKSNFLDIPMDCPQRERAGWTGDAQIFVKTGTYFADTAAFFRKWLKDVSDEQREDGQVQNINPVNSFEQGMSTMLQGSTGWADAAVIIPYTLWKTYRDKAFISDNLDLMLGWKRYIMNLAADKSMYHLPEDSPYKKFYAGYLLEDSPYKKYMVEAGIHWGEWMEPSDVGENEDVKTRLSRPKTEVSTAYTAYSMRLLSEMLNEIGYRNEADECQRFSKGAREGYQYYFVNDGDIPSDRQAELVRPLALDLLDPETAKRVAGRLNQTAIDRNYRVGTGFLSTAFILPVLSEYGYIKTAYKMLLNRKSPGWLAMVKQGATTVWETYEGFDEDNHPIPVSKNHYSLGAVCGFLFSHVAGIKIKGTNHFQIEPIPSKLLEHAKATYDSPYGTVSSSWKIEDNKIYYRFIIPTNTKADICLPNAKVRSIGPGETNLTVNI